MGTDVVVSKLIQAFFYWMTTGYCYMSLLSWRQTEWRVLVISRSTPVSPIRPRDGLFYHGLVWNLAKVKQLYSSQDLKLGYIILTWRLSTFFYLWWKLKHFSKQKHLDNWFPRCLQCWYLHRQVWVWKCHFFTLLNKDNRKAIVLWNGLIMREREN